MPHVKLAPSILSADFGALNQEIAAIEKEADYLHMDVMDGVFVPNITFGNEVLKDIRARKPLDTHLMIVRPERHIQAFARAGASILTVHAEACQDLAATVRAIRDAGAKPSVALKPATPLHAVENLLEELDQVLVMSVEPGFAGQAFMPQVLEKVRALRARAPGLDIEVDGGIAPDTIEACARAGANVFVSGSAVFSQKDRVAALRRLRALAEKAWKQRGVKT